MILEIVRELIEAVLKVDSADPIPGVIPLILETVKELTEAVLKDDIADAIVLVPTAYSVQHAKKAEL